VIRRSFTGTTLLTRKVTASIIEEGSPTKLHLENLILSAFPVFRPPGLAISRFPRLRPRGLVVTLADAAVC
jgi:hypothetical protein